MSSSLSAEAIRSLAAGITSNSYIRTSLNEKSSSKWESPCNIQTVSSKPICFHSRAIFKLRNHNPFFPHNLQSTISTFPTAFCSTASSNSPSDSVSCVETSADTPLLTATNNTLSDHRLPLPSSFLNYLSVCWVSFQLRLGLDPVNRRSLPSSSLNISSEKEMPHRKKLVMLGTGWGVTTMLPQIDVCKYDVTIVSPRNYFTFTPLLPSVCGGTLSARACIEPIRNFLLRGGKKVMDFYEAKATDVDLENRVVVCRSNTGDEFSINYDVLVLGIGAETNTYGIPGTKEHCLFLKEVENANEIHKKVLENFESASLPGISEDEKTRLLHFVVVGGGPTGVETAAEVSDFIHDDILEHFPHLRSYTKITIIEMLPKLLPTYTKEVSDFTLKNFDNMKINILLNTKVIGVTKTHITTSHESGSVSSSHSSSSSLPTSSPSCLPEEETFSFGLMVWASGVGQVELSRRILTQIPSQASNSMLAVTPQLRVIGTKNVYAVGDCGRIKPPNLNSPKMVADLFSRSQQHVFGCSTDFLSKEAERLSLTYPQVGPSRWTFASKPRMTNLSYDGLCQYLTEVDSSYKPAPASAQQATQQGEYLARVLNGFQWDENDGGFTQAPAFNEDWNGALAYVGGGSAVADLPRGYRLLGGYISVVFWRTVYLQLCKSTRNRIIVVSDWMRTFYGGRDLSREHIKDTTREE